MQAGALFPLTLSLSPGERIPRPFDALCAPEPGKDAFHRVPDFAQNEWDAVERVLTILGGRFRGRAPAANLVHLSYHDTTPVPRVVKPAPGIKCLDEFGQPLGAPPFDVAGRPVVVEGRGVGPNALFDRILESLR